MNLFWKKVFGGLQSTDKYEAEEIALAAKLARYQEVSKSAEYAEYLELQKIVKTPEFKEKKKQLQSRKYKDTEEYRVWNKFNKLAGDKKFQMYLSTKQSQALKDFLAFQQSADYAKLLDKKAVKADPKLQAMQRYERSKEFKNYLRFKDSYKADEYSKLQEEVNSPDFKQRNDFWANKHRWETTPEYKQDTRYYELSKSSNIVFIESVDVEEMTRLAARKVLFQDDFAWSSLAQSAWKSGFHYKSAALKSVHSILGEQQANMGGKNVRSNGTLSIETKAETCQSPAWDPKRGFVMKEYAYSSDIINSADGFKQKNGVFAAKIRVEGKINHGFWLGTESKLPLVSVFHYNGKHIQVGTVQPNGSVDTEVISGIDPSNWFIYKLVWNNDELVWYINNVEVKRTRNNVPQASMYMSFSSFITEAQKAMPGVLQCKWVKVTNY